MQAKKEISVAVIIGLVISVVIIGGMYRAKTALDAHLAASSPSVKSSSSPAGNTSQDGLPLKITSPKDNSVFKTSKIELAGTTKPGTYITILTETNEYIIVPSDLGNFSQEISLVKGANTIVVSTYTSQGDKTEEVLNLVYTTAQL